MRSVENTIEHLPQLVTSIFLLVFLEGPLKKQRLDLLGGDLQFIVLSAVISALSLTRGQERAFWIMKPDNCNYLT